MVDYRPLVTPPQTDPFITPSFKWGTVTQAVPLRVNLDGDSSDTGGTPADVVGQLKVGDRVYTVLVNKQLVVLGKFGGPSAADSPYNVLGTTPTAYSWNTLDVAGIHPYLMHAVNNPDGPSAFLQPGGSGYYYVQTFRYPSGSVTQFGTPYFAQDPLVWRHRYGGVWGPWSSTYTPVTDVIGGAVGSANWYRKSPGGTLVCRGYNSFPANAGVTQTFTWNFPVLFVGEIPHITVTPDTTVPQNMSVSFSNPDLDSCIIRLNRSTDSGTGVYFNATGRWK